MGGMPQSRLRFGSLRRICGPVRPKGAPKLKLAKKKTWWVGGAWRGNIYTYMLMTLEKNRAEFWGLEEAESSESEKPQGFSVSWGKMYWSTIDANGNLLNDGTKSYAWDAANRLISITYLNPQPPTVADNIQMAYDGFGRRVSITENHGTSVLTAKTFVWCGEQLCQERDSTGSIVNKQFFTLGERIGTNNFYYTFDHLGSVRELITASGAVTAQYDYDPFGRQKKLISGNLDADFGYTGFYMERAANLDLTWFRAYDADKGRWLNRDPLRERAGFNLYEMVMNNPINFIDLLGLCPTDPLDPTVPSAPVLFPTVGQPSTLPTGGGGGGGGGGGPNLPAAVPSGPANLLAPAPLTLWSPPPSGPANPLDPFQFPQQPLWVPNPNSPYITLPNTPRPDDPLANAMKLLADFPMLTNQQDKEREKAPVGERISESCTY